MTRLIDVYWETINLNIEVNMLKALFVRFDITAKMSLHLKESIVFLQSMKISSQKIIESTEYDL